MYVLTTQHSNTALTALITTTLTTLHSHHNTARTALNCTDFHRHYATPKGIYMSISNKLLYIIHHTPLTLSRDKLPHPS